MRNNTWQKGNEENVTSVTGTSLNIGKRDGCDIRSALFWFSNVAIGQQNHWATVIDVA